MNAEEAKRLTREFRESEDAEIYKLIKEAAQAGRNYVKIDRELTLGESNRLRDNGYKVTEEFARWRPGKPADSDEVVGTWISWE